MRKSIKKIVATLTAGLMAVALAATAVPAPADAATELSKAAKKAAKADFDPDGTYHAYFGMQATGSWIFRDEWYSKPLGLTGTDLKKAGVSYTGGTLFQSKDNKSSSVDGPTVTDAEIKGNGTYTVSVTGLNGLLESEKTEKMSMIYVTTDMPWSANDNPVKISDWKLKIDGKDVSLSDEVYFNTEAIITDKANLIRFDAVNTYMKDKGEYEDCPDLVALPNDSIEITFTVSGFNSDNPDASGADTSTSGGEGATSDAAAPASSGGGSPIVPIVIIAIVVVVVIVVVVKKKQN